MLPTNLISHYIPLPIIEFYFVKELFLFEVCDIHGFFQPVFIS